MKFGLFSDFNLKVKYKPNVDNFVFRLHYRFTYAAFMACVVLTTLYDVVGKFSLISLNLHLKTIGK